MKGLVLSLLMISWLATNSLTQEQDAGAQPIIEEIQFEGNSVFPDGELLDALQLTKLGDPYIPDKLEYDLHVNVGAKYRNNGYINVRVDAPRVEVIGETRGHQPLARIVVPIIEGQQFFYGRIELAGITAIPDKEAWRSLGINSQETVSNAALKVGLRGLKRLYRSYAYLDMDAAPTLTPDLKGRELDVQIRIVEGIQYLFNQVQFELTLVEKPTFQDNEKAEKDLHDAWLLTEGQLCRLDLVAESIKRINSLGYFEPLERGDWEFVKENGQADVVVRLTQKQE